MYSEVFCEFRTKLIPTGRGLDITSSCWSSSPIDCPPREAKSYASLFSGGCIGLTGIDSFQDPHHSFFIGCTNVGNFKGPFTEIEPGLLDNYFVHFLQHLCEKAFCLMGLKVFSLSSLFVMSRRPATFECVWT